MKHFKLFTAAAAILLASQGMSAQTEIESLAPYNRATVMYQTRSYGGASTNGFELGYIHGFSLSRELPFFFQTGLKMDMGFYSESSSGDVMGLKLNGKITMMSFNVPLDLAYKLVLGESRSAAFIPYIGLNMKLNTLARAKMNVKYGGQKADESVSMFDDEYGGMKHFQFGWHIGGGLQLNRFYIGLEYGSDFVAVADGGNHTPTFHVGLGYTF